MVRVLLADLRLQPVRTLLPGFALAVGLACVVGAAGVSGAYDRAAAESDAHTPEAATIVVKPALGTGSDIPAEVVNTLTAMPEVKSILPRRYAHTNVLGPDGRALPKNSRVRIEPPEAHLSSTLMKEGRLPRGTREIAVDPTTAKEHPIGAQLTIADRAGKSLVLTVVGIAADSRGFGDTPGLTASPALAAAAMDPGETRAVNIVMSGATPPDAVANAMSAKLGSAYQVALGTDAREAEQPKIISNGSFFIMSGLLALATAMLVAGAAFRAVAAARSRRTALLRALGASRWEVIGAALVEAVIVGVLAAAGALAVGWFIGNAMIAGLGAIGLWDTLGAYAESAAPPGAAIILSTLFLGVGAAITAALRPAIRASAVAPVTALSAVSDAPLEKRAGIPRIIFGLALIAIAVVLAAMGISTAHVEPILPSAVLMVLALFGTLGPIVVPLLMRVPGLLAGLFGRLLGQWSPVVQMAAREPSRTPRRAAAIALPLAAAFALLTFGVTGADSVLRAASARGSVTTGADLVISDIGGRPLPAGVEAAARKAGVTEFVTIDGTGKGGVPYSSPEVSEEDGNGSDDATIAVGAAAESSKISRILDSKMITGGSLSALGAGTAVVSESVGAVGHSLNVGARGHERVLRIVGTVSDGALPEIDVLTTPADLAALNAGAVPSAILAKLPAGANPATVRHAVIGQLAAAPTVRAQLPSDVDTSDFDRMGSITWLGWGMLGLSILAAVSGVVATTSVSVTERRGELGLVRALGSSRTAVAGQILVESFLLAVGTAIAGSIIGYLYAVACLAALSTPVALPSTGLLIAFACVGLLAMLAAIVPAVRAARVSPTVALAAT